MKRKGNGFSLIELLVVVTILMVIGRGSFVYLSQFQVKQKLEQSQKKIIVNLRLARNFALTNQSKNGDVLSYVEVEIGSDGIMTALTNGDVGSSYFSEDVTEAEVSLSKSPDTSIFFRAYEGKLLTPPPSLMPVGIGETVRITLSSNISVGETKIIEILSSGLINEK